MQLVRFEAEHELSQIERQALEVWLRGGNGKEELGHEIADARDPTKQFDCDVCAETCMIKHRPQQHIAPSCRHEPTICRPCLTQDLDNQINNKPWDQIECTLCPERLPFDSVKAFASPAAFKK